MRLRTRQRSVTGLPGVSGTVRADRRTGSLIRRLQPGDIAVLDHLDLDRASAQALVGRGVVAVVDASPLISGRYPNLGPEVLAHSGVLMVDGVGPEVFARLRDGARARVLDGAVLVGDEPVAQGRALGVDEVAALMQEARSGLATQLQSLTHNTTEFLRREPDLLLHGEGVPELATRIAGRPVVVVAPEHDRPDGDRDRDGDLRSLRRYIREQHPVLIGVDAGADALLAAGHRPDVLVVGARGLAPAGTGDEGSTVSDEAVHAAGEVVLHTDRSGHAPGADRLDRLGVRQQRLTAAGASEDVALLLADVRDASLIVTVGHRATLEELLDRQRAGVASTFLTRLRVGPKLVEATSIPALYAGRVRAWHLVLVLLAGLLALAAAVATTPVGSDWWATLSGDVSGGLSGVPDRIRGLFP